MTEPWRWRCPVGHTNWRRSGERYYCKSCSEHFADLRDVKVGEVSA